MRAELERDILEIVDVERGTRKSSTGASLVHLMARVARRPGRWRRRMARRERFEDEVPHFPEAA